MLLFVLNFVLNEFVVKNCVVYRCIAEAKPFYWMEFITIKHNNAIGLCRFVQCAIILFYFFPPVFLFTTPSKLHSFAHSFIKWCSHSFSAFFFLLLLLWFGLFIFDFGHFSCGVVRCSSVFQLSFRQWWQCENENPFRNKRFKHIVDRFWWIAFNCWKCVFRFWKFVSFVPFIGHSMKLLPLKKNDWLLKEWDQFNHSNSKKRK